MTEVCFAVVRMHAGSVTGGITVYYVVDSFLDLSKTDKTELTVSPLFSGVETQKALAPDNPGRK